MACKSSTAYLFTIIVSACVLIIGCASRIDLVDRNEQIVREFIIEIATEGDTIEDVVAKLERFFRGEILIGPEFERFHFIRERYILVKAERYIGLDELHDQREAVGENILMVPINLDGDETLPYVRHDFRVSRHWSRVAQFPVIVRSDLKKEDSEENVR